MGRQDLIPDMGKRFLFLWPILTSPGAQPV